MTLDRTLQVLQWLCWLLVALHVAKLVLLLVILAAGGDTP